LAFVFGRIAKHRFAGFRVTTQKIYVRNFQTDNYFDGTQKIAADYDIVAYIEWPCMPNHQLKEKVIGNVDLIFCYALIEGGAFSP
tara:strand:+ start:403 stop:657 length:255 start_codon:yes stop_codon:yes gene_type:complete